MSFLTLLLAVAVQAEPSPLLSVTEQPGYMPYRLGMQIAAYPHLLLYPDGRIIARQSVPGFELKTGRVPDHVLASTRKALSILLPTSVAEANMIDASVVTIQASIDGKVEKRELFSLDPPVGRILHYGELPAETRRQFDRHLKFAALVKALALYAKEPYVPDAAEILVEVVTPASYRALREPPVSDWKVGDVSLAEVAKRCAPTGHGPVKKLPLEKRQIEAIARNVVSGRLYRSDDVIYRVVWLPGEVK